ncbi:MAG: hypothetical protein GJ680_02200 [Alteromonadaceae bacterium]|nr:hypothetical protein [Alteromonadaceae bacterium]
MKTIRHLFVLLLTIMLSGCIAYTVVETAVDATTTVVGGAVGVGDAVTPDVFSDDDDDDDDNNKNNDEKE